VSARDEALVRAAMNHYTLVTVADFAALPGVAGVQDHPGEGRITIYRERDLPLASVEGLQTFVGERKPLNLLVAWKTDRRTAERRRRSPVSDPPPIPSGARWT
jgi:hypothetical protein